MSDDCEELEIAGRMIELSNPDKLLFPDAGITKRDLCEYYNAIAPQMLPFLKGRAVTMQRFPDGICREGFFQKEAPDYFPDWIQRATLEKEGGKVNHVVISDAPSLVYLAGQACITPHVALAPVSSPNRPDRLVFDLDPSGDDFSRVRDAALLLRNLLENAGLDPFCKTTGSRGLHVEVPLDGEAGFEEARAFAKRLAEHLSEEHSHDFTTAHRKAGRGGRVFIDYLRNARAQTTAPPFAVRALPGAPVATPLAWSEVEDPSLSPQKYTIANIFRRLSQIDDPWAGFWAEAVRLPKWSEDDA